MNIIRSLLLLVLFASTLGAATAATWVDTKTQENIVYSLFDSPAVIKRYDLNTETFIADINLPGTDVATAFEVDADGIYVGFGRSASRFNLDGTNQVGLTNTAKDITEIVVSETTVYVISDDHITSIAKANLSLVQAQEFSYSMVGASFSNAHDRLFARSGNVSPSDIFYMEMPESGALPNQYNGQIGSPYHGDYPSATHTHLFPDETRIVDSAGIIYATTDLTYVGSLQGALADVSFYGDLPIVLRNGILISYNNAMLETGSKVLDESGVERIVVYGDKVYGFYINTSSELDVELTALSDLNPATPGEPVNPNGLAYTPDDYAVDNNGIVYLLSKSHLSIFRWSLTQRQYLATIPLLNVPTHMALSVENNALYIAYQNGAINQIRLDGEFEESNFANLPQNSLGLATAGEYIFAVDPSGAWVSHYTYGANGELLSQKEWNEVSAEFIWSQANRKMYHFRDGISPNDLIWEDIDVNGIIGDSQDSPYHSSNGIKFPIRVAPDGSVVVLGSGRIYDAITLDQVNVLSNDIDDAVWFDGKLLTLKEATNQSTLQQWNPGNNYLKEFDKSRPGAPYALLQSYIGADHWLSMLAMIDGTPVFYPIDMGSNLDIDGDLVENMYDNCLFVANSGQEDTDFDGIGDACSVDFDNDGVNDDTDNCPTVPNSGQANFDLDAQGDACDEDDDNDIILDTVDCAAQDASKFQLLLGYLDIDGDLVGAGVGETVCSGDNLPIGYFPTNVDNCPSTSNPDQLDTDDDLLGNACDTDDDNDLILDESDNCPLIVNASQTNSDDDALGDACDENDDNDAEPDVTDCAALDASRWQILSGYVDTDSDGFGYGSVQSVCSGSVLPSGYSDNDADNCSLVNNPLQVNSDDDGLGDACDADDDNDTIEDSVDNCPLISNFDQSNLDSDTEGDLCDSDIDNDGVLNGSDTDALDPNVCQDVDSDGCDDCTFGNDGYGPLSDYFPENDGVDTDQNGICNLGDTDDDGDMVDDLTDNCPQVFNSDQADSNENGIGDACEVNYDDDTCVLIITKNAPVYTCL